MKFKELKQRLLCLLGRHHYQMPVIANLDHYWLQGGQECLACRNFKMTRSEISMCISYAYTRGKERGESLEKTKAYRGME